MAGRSYVRREHGKKECTGCGLMKPLGDYHSQRKVKDGRTSKCKPCMNAQTKDAYYRAGAEANREKCRNYRRNNLEKCRANERVRAEANREKLNARARDWRRDNWDRYTEYRRQYEKEHSERMAEHCRRRRAKILKATTEQFTVEELKDSWLSRDINPDACRYCGISLTDRRRTVDHVIPLTRGGEHARANLVPCCQPCNSSKNARTPDEMGWTA